MSDYEISPARIQDIVGRWRRSAHTILNLPELDEAPGVCPATMKALAECGSNGHAAATDIGESVEDMSRSLAHFNAASLTSDRQSANELGSRP